MSTPVTMKYGSKIWFERGRIHRKDGPAVVFPIEEYDCLVKKRLSRSNVSEVSYGESKYSERKNIGS